MPKFAPLSERDLQLFRAVFAEQKEVFEAIGWEVENAVRSVEAGDSDLALMLLFCLLPRLSSLDVLNHAISPNLIDFVLAAAGADIRDMKCPVALANLSSAFFQDGRTEDGIKYSFLLPWAALPALRTIGCYALSEDDGPTDSLLGPELRDHLDVSPCLVVTDLRLEDSSVGTEALTYLLARTKGLKRFFYEHGGHAGSAEFVPSEIRDALLQYCQSTLECLTLYDGYGYGDDNRFAGSLRDFIVLKVVDMPLEMLVEPDVNEFDSDCNSIVSDTPRLEKLGDTLPASLEILRIPETLQDTDNLVDQLIDLLERKEKSQPRLSKIAIGSVNIIEESKRGLLEEACKGVGVLLEEWRPEAAHQWPDNPAW